MLFVSRNGNIEKINRLLNQGADIDLKKEKVLLNKEENIIKIKEVAPIRVRC